MSADPYKTASVAIWQDVLENMSRPWVACHATASFTRLISSGGTIFSSISNFQAPWRYAKLCAEKLLDRYHGFTRGRGMTAPSAQFVLFVYATPSPRAHGIQLTHKCLSKRRTTPSGFQSIHRILPSDPRAKITRYSPQLPKILETAHPVFTCRIYGI